MKFFSLILLIFFFNTPILILCKKATNYSDYISWCYSKNITILPSLKFSPVYKNTKLIPKFFCNSNDTIPKDTLLITIPSSIILNITKILSLINSSELSKQYKDFMTQVELYEDEYSSEFKKDEAFLSYIFYQVHKKSKKIIKSKFYKEYKYYINSVQLNSENDPLFFDDVTLNKLYLSYINTLYTKTKRNYEEETYIFKSDSYYKKDIDFEEYLPIRLAITNTGLAISEQKIMVPLLNLIQTDYIKYNTNYTLASDGTIKIYSTKDIKYGDEILFFSPEMSNAKRLLFEGKTYEELNYYFDEYLIPAFGISLYVKFNIMDSDLEFNNYLNLLESDFTENAVDIYNEHRDILKDDRNREDDTDLGWPYEILLNNIKAFNIYMQNFTNDKIYEYFEEKEERINIERVIIGDRKILEQAYKKAERKASKYIDLSSRRTDDDEETKGEL